MYDDTIFALSSGVPPAGIGVIRVSGAQGLEAFGALCPQALRPRHATLVSLARPSDGAILDRAIAIHFPGPNTATGEDVVELHCHGGRAVIDSILAALGEIEGLRAAEPGEFTRRALENGRIDLGEAEALSDLLAAQTEIQHRQAVARLDGELARSFAAWRERLVELAARIEAAIDYGDEDETIDSDASFARGELEALAQEVARYCARPDAEAIRNGLYVVIAGPPNAGKSTLLNAIARREAAITSPLAGTTRDIVEVPVAIEGIPFRFADTAGLRGEGADAIEAIGVAKASDAIRAADLVLWLGAPDEAPEASHVIRVAAKADLGEALEGARAKSRIGATDISVSARTGERLDDLVRMIVNVARDYLPREGEQAINARQRAALGELEAILTEPVAGDPILIAETVRAGLGALDRLSGRTATEDMLDALFSRFCLGK